MATFMHVNVLERYNIYIAIPRVFRGKGKVLKLQKAFYGLRQSPRVFWKYLMENTKKCKIKQSEFDLHLLFGEKVICVVYVNDLLFWSKDEGDITQVALGLRSEGFNI